MSSANPKILIVGAGVSGIAAACRLIENGFTNLCILEADNRIGGRVRTQDIGGGIVDLGAQWCHGQGGNAVYEMVKDLNLLQVSYNTYRDNLYVESTGEILDKTLTDRMFNLSVEIIYDHNAMKEYDTSLGEYFMQRYLQRVSEEFGDNSRSMQIALRMVDWLHNFELCHDAPGTWFESSCTGLTEYWDPDGESMLCWKTGYQTILDVLMKKIPNPSKRLPVEERVLLNKQVRQINWDQSGTAARGTAVSVTCTDGTNYHADHVIVTVSLGVLKEQYKSLFAPKLPKSKINAIKGLGIGTTNKILLKFPSKWWPDDFKGFSFVWTEEDWKNLRSEYPHGPYKNGKSWLADVFGFYPIDGHPRVLLAWVVGSMGPEVEQVSDQVVVDGLMHILRKFVGRRYNNIPEPESVVRSKWYSNPYTRGSYSYRSLESDRRHVTGDDLAAPLMSSSTGRPTVLFAGEATHLHYYSTVHGALESGNREADRLINMYKEKPQQEVAKKRRYGTMIVGAGLAGLGAARTLTENGVAAGDFLILEAADRAGGRIQTVPYDDGVVELGAQWLHDTDNELYAIAEHHDLLSEQTSEEALGVYVRDDGVVFPDALVTEVDFVVGKILYECESFVDDPDYPESVGRFLERRFEEHLATGEDSPETKAMKLELLDWHVRFQIIDNACLTLHDLSARDWGKYSCMSTSGQKHVNLSGGYGALVQVLVDDLPDNCIRLNSPVNKLEWRNDGCDDYVTIKCKKGAGKDDKDEEEEEFHCGSVLVTCSLGVLKHGRCIFDPPLTESISNAIADIGFYGIGKIFLHFKERWWNTEGYQLLWRRDAPVSAEEQWTRYISGFDLVLDHPAMLMGWVGGRGLLVMERLSEQVVGQHCVSLLRRFTRDPTIPLPVRVIKSSASSNQWIRGGYSHTTPMSDISNTEYVTLSEPQWIGRDGKPRLLLAGEACHPNQFSTTHGAFESGRQQAKLLL